MRKRSQVVDSNQVSFVKSGRNRFLSSVIDNPSEIGDEGENTTIKWQDKNKTPGVFAQMEKKLAKKGPLQDKNFEEWLNHALL